MESKTEFKVETTGKERGEILSILKKKKREKEKSECRIGATASQTRGLIALSLCRDSFLNLPTCAEMCHHSATAQV